MLRSSATLPLTLLVAGAIVVGGTSRCEATDFVMHSAIHVGSDAKPVTENRTWFVGQRVYDELLGEQSEISVMDLQQQTICLLNLRRQIKTTVTFQDLMQFSAAIKVEALQSSPLARFAAAPQFERLPLPAQNGLRLKSDWLEYEVAGQQLPTEVTRQYKLFADWFSRLNSTRVGSLPPQARLELNEQLYQAKIVPETIKLTIRNNKTSQELSSRHELDLQVSAEDRLRLEQFDLDCESFREVSLELFRQ